LSAIRYLDMVDFRSIERMTLYEYEIRMTAFRLKSLDQLNKIHEQAWANQQVQATKKIGKKEVPYFNTYKKFFDFEKYEKQVLGIEEKQNLTLKSLLIKANSKKGGNHGKS
jgi:hypothetical protein